MRHQYTNTSIVQKFLLLAAITFSLGLAIPSMATAAEDEFEDEVEERKEGLSGFYMAFVTPEICATLYPELRPEANEYRRQVGEQILKDMPAGTENQDLAVPEEEKKRMMQCIDKKSTMSKNQCQQLISILTSGAAGKEMTGNQQEMEKLYEASSAMMAPCVKNQIEKTDSRRSARKK